MGWCETSVLRVLVTGGSGPCPLADGAAAVAANSRQASQPPQRRAIESIRIELIDRIELSHRTEGVLWGQSLQTQTSRHRSFESIAAPPFAHFSRSALVSESPFAFCC